MAYATLGHPTMQFLSEDISSLSSTPASRELPKQTAAHANGDKNGQRKLLVGANGFSATPESQLFGRCKSAPDTKFEEVFSVDHEQYLRIFKARDEISGENGSGGKQIALFTDRIDVRLGKKPEPGYRASSVQKIKTVNLLLIGRGGHCKQTRDGKCDQRPKQEMLIARGVDPALSVFCCAKCDRMMEYEMDDIPNPEKSTVKSLWNGFAVQVGFEQFSDLTAVFGSKRVSDFTHTLHAFATPDSPPIAVSKDMRLMVRTRIQQSGGPPLLRKDKGPRLVPTSSLEISLVETNEILHTLELHIDSMIKSLNFSLDGTLLLATLQDGNETSSLKVWSMMTGKELRSVIGTHGAVMLASFSEEGDRVFAVSVSKEGKKAKASLKVFFWNASQDFSDTFLTGTASIAGSGVDRTASTPQQHGEYTTPSWMSGNRKVMVFTSGAYVAEGEVGSVLYPFATRAEPRGKFTFQDRRDAVSLDQKRFSVAKSHSELIRMLSLDEEGSEQEVISKGSISQDGSVFAHVFNPVEVRSKGGFFFHIPSNHTVLVWNLAFGELCHRFEHERPVNCVQVSSDGRKLMVGVSGFVTPQDRLEQSRVLVYSLVSREVLWDIPIMHEIQEMHFSAKQLLFEVNPGRHATRHAVFSLLFSEISHFPCAGQDSDSRVTEVQLLHTIEENLALSMADLELPDLGTTNPGPKTERHQMQLGTDSWLGSPSKTFSSLKSWQSATDTKRMVGLCVSNDGQRYVTKWEGLGDGGLVTWLSFGDVDWGVGKMVHGENLQLLAAVGQDSVQTETIGAFCISDAGSIAVVSIQGTTRVVVLHIPPTDDMAEVRVLWEFDAEVEPKAMGVSGEKLSVMGDRDGQVSFASKEAIVVSYSLVSRKLLEKSSHRCSGKTLGIDGSGLLRVSLNAHHRVVLEKFPKGQVVYEVFQNGLQYMGISGSGSRLIMKEVGSTQGGASLMRSCPCRARLDAGRRRRSSFLEPLRDRANHALIHVNISNFQSFGPSAETCSTWLSHGEAASQFAVHNELLSRWLLFDQDVYEAYDVSREPQAVAVRVGAGKAQPKSDTHDLRVHPGRWSKVVSQLVRAKDFNSLSLLFDACPVTWACVVYSKEEELGAEPQELINLFLHGLANNERMLVQLLLQGVRHSVTEDKGAHCPVTQMELVTEFIVQCLKQSRMVDLVENFLKDLPLIKVDESDARKHVRSYFRRGRVISTGWGSRDAEALTGPWGLKDSPEEAELKMQQLHAMSAEHKYTWVSSSLNQERGYQYVVALPGLCDLECMELMTSYHASPELLDNESMRAAIRVLQADLQARLLGLPIGGHFLAFLFCIASFCGFVELAITPVGPDGFSKLTTSEIWATDEGKVGVVLGAVSCLLNFVFLLHELKKMANSHPFWTYIKPWNMIPWLSNIMAILNFGLFWADFSLVTVRSTAAVAMLLLCIKFFTFMRTVRKLSALVNMLLEIMYDMSMFTLVVAVLLLSFAGAFYCLHGKILPESERPESDIRASRKAGSDDEDLTSRNPFFVASDSILRAFVMSVLGEFSEEDLQSPLGEGGSVLTALSYSFFLGLACLVSVVGMNALIAIMNNTFTRVAESEHPVRDKEVASVMLDRLRNLQKQTRARWQKQRRWVHVLSPSEKGSLVDSNSNTMLEQIKREIRGLESRNGLQLVNLEEVLMRREDADAETTAIVRDLDNSARLNSQHIVSMQSKFAGVLKKVQEDQEVAQKEMKNMGAAIRALEQMFTVDIERMTEAGRQQPDLKSIVTLPLQFQRLENRMGTLSENVGTLTENVELIMPSLLTLQKEIGKLTSGGPSEWEWNLQYNLSKKDKTKAAAGPPPPT